MFSGQGIRWCSCCRTRDFVKIFVRLGECFLYVCGASIHSNNTRGQKADESAAQPLKAQGRSLVVDNNRQCGPLLRLCRIVAIP